MTYICYKMSLPDGKFYIGSTTEDLRNYFGSGSEWLRHRKNNNFSKYDIRKEILSQDFSNEKDMRAFERKEILKNIKNPNCLNQKVQTVSNKENADKHVCPECHAKGGKHKKNCSKYKNPSICSECKHITHLKSCSHYKEPKKCPECGRIKGHSKNCSKALICSECKAVGGKHKNFCSKYKISKCSECDGKGGHHYKTCSKAKKCKHCGYPLSSNHHAKDCPLYKKYKDRKLCPECGSGSSHKSWCSRAKKDIEICPECHGKRGNHKKGCSKYKEKLCLECGGKNGLHKDSCSKSLGKCQYCGYSLQSHKHAKDCPLYK